MMIIKQWLSRSGNLVARFYMCSGLYFLDYDGCQRTTQIDMMGNCLCDDVPERYRKFIRGYLNDINRRLMVNGYV